MPGFDKTGPVGMGPRTGRGLGWCRGINAGRGLGRYFGWNLPQTKEDELKSLLDYKKALEEELEDITKEEKKLSKGK